MPALARVGIVVIGRNEGERLKSCLDSVVRRRLPIVYVDSGSVDLSVLFARELRIDVIELDDSSPYTAARARNAGFDWLIDRHPQLEYVQFIDGDCELREGWIERARAFIHSWPDAAIVCGRVREQYPQASIYNRICDMEWKQPVGEVDGCGGNMLMRVSAFREAGGFDADVIAAEDTELCTRLQLRGWKILSLDADMVRHDAAILRGGQWWKRMVRAGHAITEGRARHGQSPARLFVRTAARIRLYGLILPLVVLLSAWPTGGWSLLLMAVYPAQFLKIYLTLAQRGEPRADAALYAAHCVVAKVPQAAGQLLYAWNRMRGRRTLLIEHKQPEFIRTLARTQMHEASVAEV